MIYLQILALYESFSTELMREGYYGFTIIIYRSAPAVPFAYSMLSFVQ